jgi:hypothetical protein
LEPKGIVFGSANYQTSAVVSPSARISVGAASSPSAEFGYWSGDEDNVANAIADSYLDDTRSIVLYDNSGGSPVVSADAELTSFDSDGFTLSWTTADATQRLVGYVALGRTYDTPPAPPSTLRSLTLLGVGA